MYRPKFIHIVLAIFTAYALNTFYTFYTIFTPEICDLKASSHICLKPFLMQNPKLELQVRVSKRQTAPRSNDNHKLLFKEKLFNFADQFERSVELNIPSSVRDGSSDLYAHVYVLPRGESVFSNSWVSHSVAQLTALHVPEAQALNLLGNQTTSSSRSTDEKVKHVRSVLHLSLMDSVVGLPRRNLPAEIYHLVRLSPEGDYLPVLYVNELNNRIKELVMLNESSSLTLTVRYAPMSIGKLRFWLIMQNSLKQLENLGFGEKDKDELKAIFVDTNFYLLMLTFAVAMFHLLFDFLAFKNDISHWKNRKTMEGLSTRSVLWRCISTFVILLYLMDEKSSLLVTIPTAVGFIIEVWKVKKAFRAQIHWHSWRPSIQIGAATTREQQTAAIDSEAMKYLSYLLYPLCLSGAVYSLFYVQHKSWYSWCINSLVNGVYAFGFLFMLPQLFVNYKLKSVAHLPWRAFMYKAFNTFIDDMFAFIITMPTAHRLACFRDDVVFLVYLYQRWLYPVDRTRVNEYGESFEDEKTGSDHTPTDTPTNSETKKNK